MGCWHSRDNGGCIGHSNMEMVCILTLKYAYLFYCGTYHSQAVLYRRGGHNFDRTPVDVSLSVLITRVFIDSSFLRWLLPDYVGLLSWMRPI